MFINERHCIDGNFMLISLPRINGDIMERSRTCLVRPSQIPLKSHSGSWASFQDYPLASSHVAVNNPWNGVEGSLTLNMNHKLRISRYPLVLKEASCHVLISFRDVPIPSILLARRHHGVISMIYFQVVICSFPGIPGYSITVSCISLYIF